MATFVEKMRMALARRIHPRELAPDLETVPVGFCVIKDSATDPADDLGYGTWVLIAQGTITFTP